MNVARIDQRTDEQRLVDVGYPHDTAFHSRTAIAISLHRPVVCNFLVHVRPYYH
jgi:hypothetical protein